MTAKKKEIQNFQAFMNPVLSLCGDGKEHTLREAIEHVCKRFRYSGSTRRLMLPSGRQPIIDNRVGWARFYLLKAGLLEATGHGVFRITDRGKQELRNCPQAIDVKYLEKFPEFVKFRTPKTSRTSSNSSPVTDPDISIIVADGKATITIDAKRLSEVIESLGLSTSASVR